MSRATESLRHRAWRVYPLRFLYGKLTALRSYGPAMRAHPGRALKFLFADPEFDNFTYEVDNLGELASLLAHELDADPERVDGYIRELEEAAELRTALTARLKSNPRRKARPMYGRRAGWYAIVRLLKPRVVVEAGVHDGLGSAVFLAALECNRAEGYPGRLIGIDIDPACGWLVPESLRAHFNLVLADSVTHLQRGLGDVSVDVFLHDSLHTYEHELAEYRAALARLSPAGVLLSDDAHATDALKDFSTAQRRRFAFWREQPLDHFYPGAGIGMSLPERTESGSAQATYSANHGP